MKFIVDQSTLYRYVTICEDYFPSSLISPYQAPLPLSYGTPPHKSSSHCYNLYTLLLNSGRRDQLGSYWLPGSFSLWEKMFKSQIKSFSCLPPKCPYICNIVYSLRIFSLYTEDIVKKVKIC